jgi:hypothetical protein
MNCPTVERVWNDLHENWSQGARRDFIHRKIGCRQRGGSGMSRELVVQLADEGYSVASCDVNEVVLRTATDSAEAYVPADARGTLSLIRMLP